jgi:hypothetical protein
MALPLSIADMAALDMVSPATQQVNRRSLDAAIPDTLRVTEQIVRVAV